MKKTLAAVAVLGAFAGSAIAADVTLYGRVDLGLNYTHISDGAYDATTNKFDDLDKFTQESGQQSGSRWGLKGTEDLGNGLTVGFILEDGFTADDGVNDDGFNRESSLFVEGAFGKLAFGRIGSINNGTSSWALAGDVNPFGTSWKDYVASAANTMSMAGVLENMIAYQTPTFAGFTVYAQYSMGGNDEGENESTTDRYYAIGATYENGPIFGYFAVDSFNYASWPKTAGVEDPDDSLTVTLGGTYDFEVAKLYLGAQYFDEVTLDSLGGITDNYKLGLLNGNDPKVTGYGVTLGVTSPVAGGKVMGAVSYVDAEQSDWQEDTMEFDFTRWAVTVGYDYPFSKRTNVYAVASYMDDEIEGKGISKNAQDWNPSAYTFMIGMRHLF